MLHLSLQYLSLLFPTSHCNSDDVQDVCRHSVDLYSLPWLSCVQCTVEGGGCKWPFPAVPTTLGQAVSAWLHPAAELSSGNILCGGLREEPHSPCHSRLRATAWAGSDHWCQKWFCGAQFWSHLVLTGPLRYKLQIVCRPSSNFSYPQKSGRQPSTWKVSCTLISQEM